MSEPDGAPMSQFKIEILSSLLGSMIGGVEEFVGPGYSVSVLIRHRTRPNGHILGGEPVDVVSLALDELATNRHSTLLAGGEVKP